MLSTQGEHSLVPHCGELQQNRKTVSALEEKREQNQVWELHYNKSPCLVKRPSEYFSKYSLRMGARMAEL